MHGRQTGAWGMVSNAPPGIDVNDATGAFWETPQTIGILKLSSQLSTINMYFYIKNFQ